MPAATYEIRVRGVISSRDLTVLEDMDMYSETVLRGAVVDQAALHGVLELIRDLGLELLDVRQLPDPALTEPGQGAPHPGDSPRDG